MLYWNLFIHTDLILFIWVSVTVLYLTVFAITSLFARHSQTPKAKNENRFIIIIPTKKNGISVEATVRSILGQTYSQRLFDVTVVANNEDEITLFHLAQQPITLLTPNYTDNIWTKSLQVAINNLPQFKIYDSAIILEAGDLVEPEFLQQMNDAYESAGTKVIQAHKLALNRDTTSARLEAIFEEINNSIFRRGHISVGLSASMASSGMVFNFDWFKNHILAAKASWADKDLEATIMREYIYVDYFDNIFVYSEKARQAEEFNRKRISWIITQWKTFFHNIHYLPTALFNRHYDLIDKLLQWMLIPRIVMMAIIIAMAIITPFIYMTAALKWWGIFTLVIFVFAIATPNYLVDEKWDSTFFKVPAVLFSSVLKRFKIGRKLLDVINLKQ